MGTRGPAPKQINWDEFDKLVSYQCTQEEIAAFFGISVDWLDVLSQRDRGEKLSEVWNKRRMLGRVRLRKAQFAIVEKGGPGAATMAIYLDKKMFPLENPDLPPNPNPSPSVEAVGSGKRTFVEFCTRAGYPAPFPKQEEMRAFAFDHEETRLCLGARGYGKSDYMTILGTAYDVYIHGVNTSNLIISKSKTRNTAMIKEIANALKKNEVELDTENATTIRVAGLIGKDHSVEAITIKSSFRGRHPKRIIMDDPVTEEDISAAARKVVKVKYDEAYKLCKNICIIGQPAHAFDLYSELREIVLKLEVPWGSIPELDADLAAMKLAGVDEKSIEMSYHLRIPEDGSSIFANLKRVDAIPFGPKVAFLDPSDGGDYTALSAFRGYMDGIAVHGKTWKKAWYHCLDEIVTACKDLGIERLAFETNKHGQQPIEQLQTALGPLGVVVVPFNSTTQKHETIVSAGSYAHMIHLSKQSDKIYTDQVIKYEYGAKNDDAPDSMARGLQWLGLLRDKKKK